MNGMPANSWLPHIFTALVIFAILPLAVGYLVLLERKVLADLQARLGPMRVGPHGLLQPLADAVKLLLKEDILPSHADRPLFIVAPLISFVAALLGFVVLPFSAGIFVVDLNIGILLVSAVSALGILGIILGGWSSNTHYSLLGALRSAAQLVSYEVALGLGLLTGITVAGSLSLNAVVAQQLAQHRWFLFSNYGAMILPFLVFMIAAVAETNRIPFDLPEAESELVAGYHTEFSGFRWSLYMLAEWGNILVVCSVAVTLFLGGWLRPFANVHWLELPLNAALPLLTFIGIGHHAVASRLVLRSRAVVPHSRHPPATRWALLVFYQAGRSRIYTHLGPSHFAPGSLRPAHVFRLALSDPRRPWRAWLKRNTRAVLNLRPRRPRYFCYADFNAPITRQVPGPQ
jgi:NADH-quinone oxidoreductase subunit H